jgi:CheY-like chemotaxis protein
MAPHERVLLVEDTQQFQRLAKVFLEKEGHKVVATVASLDEWLEISDHLKEKEITVLVTDNALGETDMNSNGGEMILKDVKNSGLPIKTVGFSSDKMPGVTVDVGKSRVGELGIEVTKL